MITLYGASGHGKVVKDVLEKNNYDITYIVDDNINVQEFEGLRVKTSDELNSNSQVIIAIGNNQIRKRIAKSISNIILKSISHPKAVIGNNVRVGDGSVIMANATVNPSVLIGEHCIINTNSVIEHDCSIGDFCHVSPGAIVTGGVRLGEGVHIGARAVILPGVSIGSWAIVGAGAVVTKDIPEKTIYVGNPAKFLRKNNE